MRRRGARAFGAFALVTLVAAAPTTSPQRADTYAAAWAVWITTPASDVIRLAAASAETGSAAHAGGAPVGVGGTSPQRADATPAETDQVVAPLDWADPTESMTIRGGFAEAHASSDTASARAGLSTASGSGFAMANQLLSEEQQTQLLTTWADTMAAVFAPINAALERLGPALALAGLVVPHLDPPPSEGFLDVALVNQVSTAVDVSSAPGIASARAETALAAVRLLAGFIEVQEVKATAVSEAVDGAETRRATATLGSLRIAGVEVVADTDGFRVARSDIVARTVLQPAIDLLVSTMARTGVTLRVAETRSAGTLREASALELEIASPEGLFSISIAHAESAAPVFIPPGDAPTTGPATSPAQPPAPLVPVTTPPIAPGRAATIPSLAPSTLAEPYAGPVTWRPSRADARALRTTYLLLIVGALLGALALPMIGRPTSRRSPSATGRRRPRTSGGIP
ncbi:MAG: choice-of-anchor P family protein [Actinomycetota bacterium]